MANLIVVKSKSEIVLMNEIPVHPEVEIEKIIFETENLMPDIYPLKRQLSTYYAKERIDVIGLDNENNVVIIEIKDEMVNESILAQVMKYALWVEQHPDAIKNIWYEQGRKPEDFDWEKEVNIRIVVVAPSFDISVPRLLNKVGYRIDLVEFKKFNDGLQDYIFLNTIKTPDANKPPKAVETTREYNKDHYTKLFNQDSAQKFWKLANRLEEYIKKKGWNLTRSNTKRYISFKYGFPVVFGLGFIGSKSFALFFKVPKKVANSIKIDGFEIYRYEDQWKQVLYKVESADINIKVFDHILEASYSNIAGVSPS